MRQWDGKLWAICRGQRLECESEVLYGRTSGLTMQEPSVWTTGRTKT